VIIAWGKELYADGTLADANADRDKMLPRFAVAAHLQQWFGEVQTSAGLAGGAALSTDMTEPVRADSTEPSLTLACELGANLAQP
jgi:hypothetical protein